MWFGSRFLILCLYWLLLCLDCGMILVPFFLCISYHRTRTRRLSQNHTCRENDVPEQSPVGTGCMIHACCGDVGEDGWKDVRLSVRQQPAIIITNNAADFFSKYTIPFLGRTTQQLSFLFACREQTHKLFGFYDHFPIFSVFRLVLCSQIKK